MSAGPLFALFPILCWFFIRRSAVRILIIATFGVSVSFDIAGAMSLTLENAFPSNVIGVSLMALMHLSLWVYRPSMVSSQIVYLAAAFIILCIPPFGVLLTPSPILAAGILFPGFCVFGIVLLFGFIAVAMITLNSGKHRRTVTLTALIGITATNIIYDAPVPPINWAGVTTNIGPGSAEQDIITRRLPAFHRGMSEVVNRDVFDAVIVYPETILPYPDPVSVATLRLIHRRAIEQNLIVIFGGQGITTTPRRNIALFMGAAVGEHDARQPVPGIFWNPLDKTAVQSDWRPNKTYVFHDKRTAILICWEEWVIWPLLSASFADPDVVASLSNHGWAKGDRRLWKSQTHLINAQLRLFGLPAVRSVNF